MHESRICRNNVTKYDHKTRKGIKKECGHNYILVLKATFNREKQYPSGHGSKRKKYIVIWDLMHKQIAQAAFISETCECSLTSDNLAEGFFYL